MLSKEVMGWRILAVLLLILLIPVFPEIENLEQEWSKSINPQDQQPSNNSDSLHTLEFKKHFIIVPNTKFTSLRKDQLMKILKSKGGKLRKKEFSYSSDSNTKFLSVSELRDLIQKLK